jgi:hypothetical protein
MRPGARKCLCPLPKMLQCFLRLFGVGAEESNLIEVTGWTESIVNLNDRLFRVKD